jgi:diadenosine tetraphosphate (Ap4A) HIT family hydrolase
VGDRLPVGEVPRALALEARDRPIEYTDDSGKLVELPVCQQDLLVREGEHCAVFLDAQARPMYVSVLARRFERRQSALSDAELLELWQLPIAEACANHASGIVDARVNAGSAQNVAHVHLKVWCREDEFVARWSEGAVFQALRHASRLRKEARAAAAAAAASAASEEESWRM